jgi:putative ABC transport system substrate-binding protein
MPVIGVLNGSSPEASAGRMAAFRQGLSETGFTEGRNVAIEYRWARNQLARLPMLAAELVNRQVTVIVTIGSTEVAEAAKAATATIPIVSQIGSDPVALGLVASLSSPGGNLTGVTTLAADIAPKRLELLCELVPAATDIAVLLRPGRRNTGAPPQALQEAAQTLRVRLHALPVNDERDFDAAFERLAELRVGALQIYADPLFNNWSQRLAALSLRNRLPAIYQFRDFAAGGGLMSYGVDLLEGNRLMGIYTGRILKGEKPADLPVKQVTKFELIINMKTAKALGLRIPPSVLAIVDEVIE